MGLEHLAALSNSETIENPRFFRIEEAALKKAQKKLSAQKKASKARAKARKAAARIHERISNKRHNFAHQLSRKLVNIYNIIISMQSSKESSSLVIPPHSRALLKW